MYKGHPILHSLIGITLFSGFTLAANSVSAENIIDQINITIPESCSVEGIIATGGEHTKTVQNNQYYSEIGTTTFKTYCNDNNGYAIYAIGYSNDEFGNTLMKHNSSSAYDFDTGTASSGNTSNWAMKLAPISGAYTPTIHSDTNGAFTNYHVVPSTYTKVVSFASNTDLPATGVNAVGSGFTSTYASWISATQVAGTYTGKVKYTLVHPITADAPSLVTCNPSATTISQAKCMQDFAGPNRDQIITSMTPETQYTLKDKRDGKSYTIAKFHLGNNYDVWMTKNLDFNLNSSVTYTNEDTDIGYNPSTGLYEAASWIPSTSTTTSQATEMELYINTPWSYDPGELYWNGVTASNYLAWNNYIQSCGYTVYTCDQSLNPISEYTDSTGIPQYHLGNFYNWAAALAMNDSSSITTDETIIEQSICPAGWTLPRSGTNEDSFYALWNTYGFSSSPINGTNKLWTSPLYFPPIGNATGGLLQNIGVTGNYWTAVSYFNHLGAHDAGFGAASNNLYTSPLEDYETEHAYSIRCIARPVVSNN